MKNAIKLLTVTTALLFAGQITLASTMIKDDLPDYLYKLKVEKSNYKPIFLQDDTAPKDNGLKKTVYKEKRYNDLEIILTNEDKLFIKPVYTGVIDFREGTPVYITSSRTLKTKQIYQKFGDYTVIKELPLIGTPVKFKVSRDVIKDGKVFIPKGSIVNGIVGNVIVQEGGGSPGEITIERLRTKDVNGNTVFLTGNIYNAGKTTALISYTIGVALAPFTFGFSTIIAQAVGGTSGQIKQGKTYTVYYK